MIAKKYLEKQMVMDMKIAVKNAGPIQYIVWEDFIDESIYAQAEKEIQTKGYTKVDTHDDNHRLNKTVLLTGESLQKIFDFFESAAFEKYLGIFLGRDIKQEFYVDKEVLKEFSSGSDFTGAVAQIYEKGDFFDWHIDGPIEKGSLGAFTYYLGGYEGEWEEEYGGNLEFGKKMPDGDIVAYEKVLHKKNTLVLIIASDAAYHRVTPMNDEHLRLSIQSTIMKK